MPRSSSTIYVGNIPEDLRRDELKRIFGRYGNIVAATLPVDYYTGIPKGFAFVQFEDIRDAEESFDRLQGYRIGKRSLRLEFATGTKKTPDEMRVVTRRGRSNSPGNRRRSRSGDRRRSKSRDYRRRSRSGEYRRRSRSGEYRRRTRSPVMRRRSPEKRSRSNPRRRSRSVEVRRSRSFRRPSGSPIMSRRNRSRSLSRSRS